jgi:hypothetical protein
VGDHLAVVLVADIGVVRDGIADELLEGPDGRARGEGDRLDGRPGEVGEEAVAVRPQVADAAGIEATLERVEVSGECRADGPDLILGPAAPSGTVGG